MRHAPLPAFLPPMASLCLAAGIGPACGACSQDRGRMPVARLRIEPRYVPAGQPAEVLLDGRRSCDEVDHPETCDKSAEGTTGPPQSCPGGVTFQWALDVAYEVVPGEGGPTSPYMRVRVTPDRPITVTLTVTDCDHNRATASGQIGITLPYPAEEPDAGTP